ncbi:hypothetical protein HK099_002356, partial [Clydaea vesicula]
MTAEAKLSFNDYSRPAQDSLTDFASFFQRNVLNGVSQAEAKLNEIEFNPQPKPKSDTPQSLAHAFGRVGYYGSFVYSSEDPTAIALKKFSESEEKIGDLKLKFDSEAVEKFHKKLASLTIKLSESNSFRRHVLATRLSYDASRASFKSSKPEKVDEAKAKMEQAEDAFVKAVDDSMAKMKSITENRDFLPALADLVAIQLSYFKSAHEILAELS